MTFSRRKFLQASFLSGAVFLMDGCTLFGVTTPLQTFTLLHKDLFPQAQHLGIQTAPYMQKIFHHSRISDADKTFLKNGVKWLNEEAIQSYRQEYTKLSPMQRQSILENITQTEWGESFVYDVMNYMFEAMLGDPVYGGNNKEAGWQWLNFKGGQPRPQKVYM
ncbi:gluconate 2-dehydrogenase subunit 3 family protein [Sulfurimonas sp. NW7]|uniref:gluconate 2-dehydrogenase subunit 3 family protein n=1 Tax=Sulfurimonas sp. NW7 TaxID=2922727 RepID=UPI003DA8FCEC